MENSKLEDQEKRTTECVPYIKSKDPLSLIQRSFKIDFSKVETLEHVIDILKALNLHIYWCNDNCPEQFKDLYEKGLLIEDKMTES